MAGSAASYVLRHCRPQLAKRDNGVWRLAELASRRTKPQVLSTAKMPSVLEASSHVWYKRPTLVFFSECPTVDTRQRASEWAGLVRKQTGWTEYVFGKDHLFPSDRQIVLVSPPPSCPGDAYLQHARLLVPSPPLVCLRDVDAVSAAARAAGAAALVAADVSPEDASASCAAAPSLGVGDGFAEFGAADAPVVAIVGPNHTDAAAAYDAALEAVRIALAGDAYESDDDRLKLAEDTLSGDDFILLADHHVYVCASAPLFPLPDADDAP